MLADLEDDEELPEPDDDDDENEDENEDDEDYDDVMVSSLLQFVRNLSNLGFISNFRIVSIYVSI